MVQMYHSDGTGEETRSVRSGGFFARAGALCSAAVQNGLNGLFPALCLGCETRIADRDTLCALCWSKIDFIRPPLCDRLGLPLNHGGGHDGPVISAAAAAYPPVFARARAVALYDGLMRQLIHKLKFGDRHDGRRLFARWLREAGDDLISTSDVIVPVPLARWRLITRRFNQAEILARDVAKISALPIDPFALKRRHTRAHQVDLTRNERLRNVAGIFSVSPDAINRIAGRRVLLIDDVVTTGATVSAAARMLLSAGASEVNVLALALTDEPGIRR